MPKIILYIFLLFSAFGANAQYYLRGEITNEKNQPLPNVKIFLHSSRAQYISGNTGGFGISTIALYDTLSFTLDGYEPKCVKVKTDVWQQVTLKVLPAFANRNRPKLISITKDLTQTNKYHWLQNDETYFQLVENETVDAKRFPNTGFSLNVNKASYSNVRRFINAATKVPPDAVRMEELLNYFNLYYTEPVADETFKIRSQVSNCPWDSTLQLLYLNINAKKLALDKIPPGNFVFLIDVSGSMDMPNRLPLLKAAFQMFVKNLRPIDSVSIVTYGGGVGIWLPPTNGGNKEKIIHSIEELEAAGDTPGEAAIMTAYKLAESTFIKNGNNRVILATDGDFNVGISSEKALDDLITKEKQTGVYLTCLGVGMGNFKDSKLETLAKRGNGNFAYLDDIGEAEKVLVKELTQTLYTVADNVYLNVQFNPKAVSEYRLIGFDNKKDAVADTTIEMEGGEIGSGNSMLAIFEVRPSENASQELRMANISLRYHLPNDSTNKLVNYYCDNTVVPFNNIDPDLQFGTAVTMLGLKLKQSKHAKQIDWESIKTIAEVSAKSDSYLQSGFLQLLQKAQDIYVPKKKKKKDISK